MFRGELFDHALDVGRAGSAAFAERGTGAHGHLGQSPGAIEDGPLDRPVFDVLAPADGFQTLDRRMQIVGGVHSVKLTQRKSGDFLLATGSRLLALGTAVISSPQSREPRAHSPSPRAMYYNPESD